MPLELLLAGARWHAIALKWHGRLAREDRNRLGDVLARSVFTGETPVPLQTSPATKSLVRTIATHPAAFRPNTRASGARKRFSIAPQKRITSPWMTTTMSRFIFGRSNESCDPP